MKPFTLQDAVQKIRELAQKQPDFIYTEQPEYQALANGTEDMPSAPQCSYVAGAIGATTGQACIVGQALSSLGVPEGILRQYEGDAGGDLVFCLSGIVLSPEDESTSESVKAHRWINDVQTHQDGGLTWADAVSFADESEVERSLYK